MRVSSQRLAKETIIISDETLISRRSLLSGTALMAAGSLLPSTAIGALGQQHQQQFRAITKSLWVSKTSLNQLPDVLTYAQRWNFKTLVYAIPPHELMNLTTVDSITAKQINKARRQDGFKFIVLSGDPHWAFDGNNIPKEVQNLLKVHRNTGGLFDGFQLNVEPHVLKAWRGSKRRQLAEGYYQLIKSISRETKALKLPLSSTLYPSYARVAVPSLGSSILQSVVPYLNDVSISAYRNVPRRTFRVASLTLRQLSRTPVPWWLGVKTQNNRNANKTSYVNKSPEYFIESLSKIDTMAKATRARKHYAGIAIQHHKSVMRLTGN